MIHLRQMGLSAPTVTSLLGKVIISGIFQVRLATHDNTLCCYTTVITLFTLHSLCSLVYVIRTS